MENMSLIFNTKDKVKYPIDWECCICDEKCNKEGYTIKTWNYIHMQIINQVVCVKCKKDNDNAWKI